VRTQLGDLLDQAREQCFVGRRDELATFDDALAGRSTQRVLIVHGPGGIGKTTLLQELHRRTRIAGRSALLLDGRQVDPSPAGFRETVGAASPDVFLIDAYEQLAPIDGWLRQQFVPSLGASSVAVLSGAGRARGGLVYRPGVAGGSSRSIGSTISTRRTAPRCWRRH
jgi:hypothetical protein